MYIYELPFDINKKLCRLLDNDDIWKDLAGRMNYSAFDVNEIEQTAKRQTTSPTSLLLIRWGQFNHRAEELLVLLYRMKHFPAMSCLIPVVDKKFQKLANKHDICGAGNTAPLEENLKRHKTATKSESIPLPVMLIENKGQVKDAHMVPLPVSNTNGRTTTAESSTDVSMDAGPVEDELMKTTIPVMQYRDLEEATGNWSQNNLLGRGGFGQVYKGEWKLLPVAVKVLSSKDNHKELIRELTSDQFRHDNILPLYGYSVGGPKVCLVYQLMTGGSLDHRLKCTTYHPPLTWCQRYMIAQGVARGLSYLHTMCRPPLIHGDIKPANILLDQCTMPKIGDFGLARRGTHADRPLLVSKIHGTRPYIPNEYLRSHRISPAVDVFSYGVVLFEMATVQKPLDPDRRKELLSDYMHSKAQQQGFDMATLEDAKLINTAESFPLLCRAVIRLGLACAWQESARSPAMPDVYAALRAMPVPEDWL
ncbi:serine/threonine-protein kinase pelle [Cydia splendana]|uniref:serine/threonine-protein kinase pelle n=1 Tax=Cydia splendana TaxID=1100963 RepID=UPI002136A87A